MATTLRAELSENHKYWINKNRYYELKHFCLQYPVWVQAYKDLEDISFRTPNFNAVYSSTNIPKHSPTEKMVMAKLYLEERIGLIKSAAYEADSYLADYILKGVTEGLSYTYLKTNLNIPCGKDMYYDRYRKFFWILSNSRK